MTKLIGAVIIVLVCTVVGFQIARRYADRSRQIRMFVAALKVLETEIFYAATPLSDACDRMASRVPAPVGTFFLHLSTKLRDGRGITAAEAWTETLAEHRKSLVLRESDYGVLHNFGQTLGVSDREDQIKHIHLAVSHLGTEETQARDDQVRYEKMWRSLGVLLGLTVVILLY